MSTEREGVTLPLFRDSSRETAAGRGILSTAIHCTAMINNWTREMRDACLIDDEMMRSSGHG